MESPAQLLCLLLFLLPGSQEEVILTQSPASVSVSLGERVTIKCKASQSLLHSDGNTYLYWYQHKKGELIKALIYRVSNLHSGVPSRFSGSGSGTDFTLTISRVEPEDIYFCGQGTSFPYTQFSCLKQKGPQIIQSLSSGAKILSPESWVNSNWFSKIKIKLISSVFLEALSLVSIIYSIAQEDAGHGRNSGQCVTLVKFSILSHSSTICKIGVILLFISN
uniref:Ig-like domain-containing protein n=1 Tax=Monodelphis domestica TaxID=13616 RepID=A0A5F8G2X4_MONDO